MITVTNDIPKKGINNKYYYLYTIVNNINGHFYIGIHTSTRIPDSYIGSGKRLHIAYEKYGVGNFTKYINEFFDSPEDMLNREEFVVNESLIGQPNCYNLIIGGGKLQNLGKTVVKDKNGKTFNVDINDPRIGIEFEQINKGMVTVIDDKGNHYRVTDDNPDFLSGKLVGGNKGYKIVKDSNGKIYRLQKDDPRILSGEFTSIVKDTVTVKDSGGKTYRLQKDDPRVISGEFQSCTKGLVSVIDKNGKTLSVPVNDPRIKTGELVSVNKSRVYITNGIKNKMVYKSDVQHFLQQGWRLGMIKKGNIMIYRNNERKLIDSNMLSSYIEQGWQRGQGVTKPKSGRPRNNM